MVFPADEEIVIARAAAQFLSKRAMTRKEVGV